MAITLFIQWTPVCLEQGREHQLISFWLANGCRWQSYLLAYSKEQTSSKKQKALLPLSPLLSFPYMLIQNLVRSMCKMKYVPQEKKRIQSDFIQFCESSQATEIRDHSSSGIMWHDYHLSQHTYQRHSSRFHRATFT